MRLPTVRGVVKRHEIKGWPSFGGMGETIEDQIAQADIFEEEVEFVFKEKTLGYTFIRGRYINYDWYYINDRDLVVYK